MKYLTLIIALLAASVGAAQTWEKTTDLEGSPAGDHEDFRIAGTGSFVVNDWLNVSGSSATTPPWTASFAELKETFSPKTVSYSVPPEYGTITYRLYFTFQTGSTGAFEGWTLQPGGTEKLRRIDFKTWQVTQPGGGD